MADDDNITISKKNLQAIIAAVILGVTGLNQGVQMLFPVRADAFTRSDFFREKEQLVQRIEANQRVLENYKAQDNERCSYFGRRLSEMDAEIHKLRDLLK